MDRRQLSWKGLSSPADWSSQTGIAQVGFKCHLGVSLNPSPKLQSNGLRQAIVNIIERCLVNMALPLPTHGLAVEGNLPQLDPRHILAQQLPPNLMPLLRRQVGFCVNPVLEVVHHGTIGNECQGVCQMGIAELSGIATEKALRPGPREKLHGHRVDLTAL